MNRFCFLVAHLFSLTITDVCAHALWIATSPTGKKGHKQTVTIVYAEPGETPEKVSDWYSNVNQFELWLISPDQQKTKLTITPAGWRLYACGRACRQRSGWNHEIPV